MQGRSRSRRDWLLWVGVCLLLSSPLDALQAKQKSDIVPGVDHVSRSAEEWLSELRESGGRSRDALWCCYHSCSDSESRREELVELLLELLHGDLSPWMRRDVETILGTWGAGFEIREDLPERDERPRDMTVSLPPEMEAAMGGLGDRVAVPSGVGGLTIAQLEEALDSEDPVRAASAGAILGWDPERSAAIAQHLLRSLHRAGDEVADPGTGTSLDLGDGRTAFLIPEKWARSRAISIIHGRVGTKVSHALLEIATAPDEDDGLRLTAWRQLTWTWNGVAGWLELLAQYPVETTLHPRTVWTPIARVHRFWSTDLAPDPDDSTPLDPAVERCLLATLRASVREWKQRAPLSEEVDTIGWIGVKDSDQRRALRDSLLSLTSRRDTLGLRSIYWLALWEEIAPEWEQAYISALQTVDLGDQTVLEWFPRVRGHTEPSLEAFRRAYERAPDQRPLVHAVAAAEEGADADLGLSADLLARLGPDDWRWWFRAFTVGLRGNPSIDSSDPESVQACKLGLQVRWKREHAEDTAPAIRKLAKLAMGGDAFPSREADDSVMTALHVLGALGERPGELIRWCPGALADPWGRGWPSYDYLASYLSKVPLTRAEQARLYRAKGLEDGRSGGLMELFARQGPGAVEWAGRIRLQAEQGWIGDLRHAIDIAGSNGRDEFVLRRALRSDLVDRRLEALRIIDEYDLRSEALDEAREECLKDPDDRVRRLARD